MKVLTIFGTRPEAVKLAPVIQQLEQAPGVESLVCVTAQHREMLDQVLRIFEIIPEIDLDLMREDQSLAELSAAVFSGLDMVFREIRPDWVLIQGDTTTVMAAGLLAYFHRIRVGHVEAGLRTGDKWQPFPEEVNRRVAGVVADLHFAPTEWARQNLLREGVPEAQIRGADQGDRQYGNRCLAADCRPSLSAARGPAGRDPIRKASHSGHGAPPREFRCAARTHLRGPAAFGRAL